MQNMDMFNFDFVIPSILILCIIFAFFLLRPKIPILRYRSFLALLGIQFLVVIFDVLSSYTDANYDKVSIPLNFTLNMFFFLAYLGRVQLFFLFNLVVLRLHFSLSHLKRFLVSIVFLASELITLSSIFTHAVFYIDETGYHRGPLYVIIFVCFFFYLFFSLFLLIRYRKRLNRYERAGAISATAILLAGNVVRILLPNYIVMNMFCLFAIMILFLTFVNTDLYLAEGGAFNLRALDEVLFEGIEKKNYKILAFSPHNNIDLQEVYGIRQLTKGVGLVTKYLKQQYPKQLIIYLGVGRFVIVGTREMEIKKMIQELQQRFRDPWQGDGVDVYLDAGFVYLSDESGYTDSKALIDSLSVTLSEIGGTHSLNMEAIDLGQGNAMERIVQVKRSLNRAIEENKVEIYLQPLVRAETGVLAGAEALARIRDENGTLIPPGEFIPVAERNGQINPLSDQVMERVCDFIRENDMEALGLEYINVNLSPIQCQNQELYQHISGIFERKNVPAHYIHLEITEETMVDFTVLLEQMNSLQKAGFNFALDDYGSGYSNISRVHRFPFVNIKIDMEIVKMHCANPDRMLPTIIELFKDKGFSVTAEGVETEEMAKTMTELGCDYLQGYYYSPPVPVEEFIQTYGTL